VVGRLGLRRLGRLRRLRRLGRRLGRLLVMSRAGAALSGATPVSLPGW
jgi:hypothetical protein